jgi:Co/Zn/Cd efflux system component
MLIECSGIIIGLFSRYLATLRKNNKYNFGYGRLEVIGTLINSILLIFLSIYIVFEAISRSIHSKYIHKENLILNSLLRLLINLIGIYFFIGLNLFQNKEYINTNNSHNNNKNNIGNIELSNLSSNAKLNNFDEEKNINKNSGRIYYIIYKYIILYIKYLHYIEQANSSNNFDYLNHKNGNLNKIK